MNFRNSMNYRVVRYALVGGVAFIADTATLYGLTTYAGLQYLLSNIGSFTIGVAVNYLLSLRFVFGDAEQQTEWGFGIFLLIGISGLILTELVMWFFTEWIGFHYLFSKIVAVVAVFSWNYQARKKICFGLE